MTVERFDATWEVKIRDLPDGGGYEATIDGDIVVRASDYDEAISALRLVERGYHGQQDHGGRDPKSAEIRAVRAVLAKVGT